MAKNKLQAPPVDEYVIGILEGLLANLVGDQDRTLEMDRPIYRSDLPESVGLHRDMLDVIHDCATRSIPPTRENVLMGLAVRYNRKGADTESGVNAILEQRTEDGQVQSLATWLGEDLKRRKASQALEQSHAILWGYEGSIDERLERAASLITSEIGGSATDSSLLLDHAELMDHGMDVLHTRYEQRLNGLPAGPSLKFKGFTGEYGPDGLPTVIGLVPRLRWGDSTVITGASKSGKTALGGILAEHNAWVEGIDVLYIHLETTSETVADRSITRNALIPGDYLTAGLLNVNNPEGQRTLAERSFHFYNDWSRQPVKSFAGSKPRESGRLYWHYVPGWNVFQVLNDIALAWRQADLRGQGLLVIVDYYNIIDNSMFQGKTNERLGRVAFHLREGIKRENLAAQKNGGQGVHMIVFAQQSEENGETYAYGSKEIVQYSQLHIAIRRDKATGDYIIPGDKRDALGMPRYYHRLGEWDANGWLEVVVGNDNAKGKCPVRFENRMYRIGDRD